MAAGQKTGGRQKGTPNKKTLERREELDRARRDMMAHLPPEEIQKLTPLEIMLRVARFAFGAGALALALEAAKEAAPYCHAKKAPIAERPADAPTVDEIALDDDPEMAEG